jgi:FSR family fosmidomycin resistance protein-like MFS transporter
MKTRHMGWTRRVDFEQKRPIVHHGENTAVAIAGGDRTDHEEVLMNPRAIALLLVGHFLIDLCQGVVPALAPFLVEGRGFSATEAAGLVFAISATSSVVQPLFGQLADRLAMSWLLPASILLTGTALALGAQADSYAVVLGAFGLSGLGVAAFHPEAARKAHLASGDRRTTGMSFFSLGGGLGFALAPATTKVLAQFWGTAGLLTLLIPTGIIAVLLAGYPGPTSASAHTGKARNPILEGRDDWTAFWSLSGTTVSRSIVFYGLNTFLALYFMNRWHQSAAEASWASVVFLGTSIVGTLLGGWSADRFGRRAVIRTGFVGATVFLMLFLQTANPRLALWLLVPLAVFAFLPTSVLVVLGQEYLPHRLGVASGVTLGLAVSVGGMCTPLLGRLGEQRGMSFLFTVLLGVLATAALQAFTLPPVGRRDRLEPKLTPSPVTADR